MVWRFKLGEMRVQRASLFAFVVLTSASSGCGLLLGNIKPADEKSEGYGIMDLAQRNPDWKKLPSSKEATNDAAASDVAYQSATTSSVISLNSACRPTIATEERDLKAYTDQLFLGIREVTHREEKSSVVQGVPALETTLTGKVDGEMTEIRSVVVRRGECVYDLMYVARPEHFPANEADFAQFVASLKLR